MRDNNWIIHQLTLLRSDIDAELCADPNVPSASDLRSLSDKLSTDIDERLRIARLAAILETAIAAAGRDGGGELAIQALARKLSAADAELIRDVFDRQTELDHIRHKLGRVFASVEMDSR